MCPLGVWYRAGDFLRTFRQVMERMFSTRCGLPRDLVATGPGEHGPANVQVQLRPASSPESREDQVYLVLGQLFAQKPALVDNHSASDVANVFEILQPVYKKRPKRPNMLHPQNGISLGLCGYMLKSKRVRGRMQHRIHFPDSTTSSPERKTGLFLAFKRFHGETSTSYRKLCLFCRAWAGNYGIFTDICPMNHLRLLGFGIARRVPGGCVCAAPDGICILDSALEATRQGKTLRFEFDLDAPLCKPRLPNMSLAWSVGFAQSPKA